MRYLRYLRYFFRPLLWLILACMLVGTGGLISAETTAVLPPIVTPGSGTYEMPFTANIDYPAGQSARNAAIYITFDGTTPTETDFLFRPEAGDTLTISTEVTLKAKSFLTDGSTSDEVKVVYKPLQVTPDPPIVSPDSGTYAMPLTVSIDYAAGQDATNTDIRYTLDGSEPTLDSFIFYPDDGNLIYLNYGATVKARAFDSNGNGSDTVTRIYESSTLKVATPTISPNGGTHAESMPIVLSTETEGAEIRYRTDGRAISFFYPGTIYEAPFTLPPGSYEITARGYKEGYYKSDIAYGDIMTITEVALPSPAIYPLGGEYTDPVTVYLGSTVLGASIRYTVDGSDVTEDSAEYSEPFVLNTTTTVQARTFLDGYTPSPIISHTYTLPNILPAPTIYPSSGQFTDDVTVYIGSTVLGADIRYTVDGSEPDENAPQYVVPFDVTESTTVKARIYLDTYGSSDYAEATYTIVTSTPTVVNMDRVAAQSRPTTPLLSMMFALLIGVTWRVFRPKTEPQSATAHKS